MTFFHSLQVIPEEAHTPQCLILLPLLFSQAAPFLYPLLVILFGVFVLVSIQIVGSTKILLVAKVLKYASDWSSLMDWLFELNFDF